MVIRKLSLAEWFLHYQLKQLEKGGFSLGMNLRVDVTESFRAYQRQGQKYPLNALVLQALGRWAEQNPAVNRILFRTFMGLRFLEMREVRVNFPVEFEHAGQKLVGAIAISNPHKKSIQELHQEIKAAKSAGLEKYPVNRLMFGKGNYFWNRWFLQGLHTLTSRFPQVYARLGGGGLTFSSLTHAQSEQMGLIAVARAHTGYTFCLNNHEETSDGVFLNFGVAFNHSCHTGADTTRHMCRFSEELSQIALYKEGSANRNPAEDRRTGMADSSATTGLGASF